MKSKLYQLLIAILAVLWVAASAMKTGPANAEESTLTPSDAITRLFTDNPIMPEWFTQEFLAAVPTVRVNGIVNGLTSDFGGFIGVEFEGGQGVIRLENALVPTEITLDEDGRIAGLFFHPPEIVTAKPEDTAAAILNVSPGETAILAAVQSADGGWSRPVNHRAVEAMAVGSAFKLAVLRAYEDAVEAGRLNRSDVVALQPEDISLPSGVLQTMRPNTPITLETLAGLMMQHSDNTATDALIRVLGPDDIEVLSPRNAPLLTTASFFKLIAEGNDAYRSRFAGGDVATRRQVLDEVRTLPLPEAAAIASRVTWPDAEWFFTAQELCDLLVSLKDAPSLSGAPNPLVAHEGWTSIGYKGGSEFGVLNLSASGVTPEGHTACAIVTINARDAVPEERVALLFRSLLGGLSALD